MGADRRVATQNVFIVFTATEYLDLNYTADAAERDKIFARLCDEEEQLKTLPPKLRARIREEEKLMKLLREAHEAHEAHGDLTANRSESG